MTDFGRADLLEPEAIGEPGERVFRVRVMSGGEAASLWLEKEQLAALTMAIRHLLEQTASSGESSGEPESAPAGETFPQHQQVDFKVGRLGIGYDEERRIVSLFAYAIDDADDAPPSFACQVSRGQCSSFAERAEEIISSGRPICVLCGGPIDRDGHKCLRRNGHTPRPVPQE